eukprot:8511051-Lingulodinium_polyedra.AAC.1
MQSTMVYMIKSLLMLGQQMREVRSVLFDAITVPTKNEVMEAIVEERKKYGTECAARGKGHELGPPTPYVARALLKKVGEKMTDEQRRTEDGEYLIKKTSECDMMDSSEIMALVSFVKVEKTFHAENKRLILKMHGQIREPMLQFFVAMEG